MNAEQTEYKEKIEAAKRDFLICSDAEAENAFEFVAKCLEAYYGYVASTEPQATVTLRQIKDAEFRVYHFLGDLAEDLEEQG